MSNILIIGGGGYLGSVLVSYFNTSGLGNKTTVVDSLLFKQGSLVANQLLNTHFLKTDVMDIPDSIINESDIIYLLAAHVGPLCDKDKKEAWRVNVEFPEKLVSKLKNQKLIYACSSSGYGQANKLCNENTPMKSISLYGKSKEEAEKIIMKYKNATSFRLATVWGYSFRHRFDLLVNDLVWQALKNQKLDLFQGDYMRCYVNIFDVVDIMFLSAFNKTITGEILNIAGDNCTKTQLVEKITRYIPNLQITYSSKKDKDKRSYFIDCNKIKQMGFKINRTLNNSLQDLIKYYNILDETDYKNSKMRNI